MGQNEVIIVAIFVVPVLLLLVLRANSALVFLSMCTGYAVGKLLGPDISAFTDMLMPGVNAQNVQLGLIIVPALLTTLFYARAVKGARFIMGIIPALAAGCLLVALCVPLLRPMSAAITSLPLWHEFMRVQSLIIGVGAVASLLFVWLSRPSAHKTSGEKKSA